MESEYFLPAIHRAWDPAGANGYYNRKEITPVTPRKGNNRSRSGSGSSSSSMHSNGDSSVPNSPSSRRSSKKSSQNLTSPSRMGSPTRRKSTYVNTVSGKNGTIIEKDKEACARCALNYALFLQWVLNDIGQANVWFTKALAMAPGDPMVNGCYHDFFNRGKWCEKHQIYNF
jgi:hypothetical protein